jgi:hypothetical protein
MCERMKSKEPPTVTKRCITQKEFVTNNDKPRIVAHRYIIEASIDIS